MAGLATDHWEFRATGGTANGGGGFDTASGGTDYSNQDAAQAQWTNLSTAGIGSTALTDDSAGGLFTSAMIGNYIQIRSGTNIVAGFYRVTAFTDTNNVTIDRAADDGVGGIAAASGDLGGAIDILLDSFFDGAGTAIVPGSHIYIKNDGTMTLTVTVGAILDGTASLPITIEGYNATRDDAPIGTDRPVLALGANSFNFDNFYHIKNLITSGTGFSSLRVDNNGKFINCKSSNTSGTGDRSAILSAADSHAISCQLNSTNGNGYNSSLSGTRLFSCYIHDSVNGVNIGTADTLVVNNCIFDTCSNAGVLGTTGNLYNLIINNVFYNCGSGFEVNTTSDGSIIINNIFDSNTDGILVGDTVESYFVDYNIYNNNGTDVTGVTKGPNAINSDPNLTDPANQDFTVSAGSVALDAALGLKQTDIVGEYRLNIGADMSDYITGGTVIIANKKRII